MRRFLSLAAVLLLLAVAPEKPPRDVLPDVQHERVDYWVDQFSHTPDYREKVAAAFERTPHVEKLITSKLRDRGLPQNLIYLAMEESALNPKAHSKEAAVGVWQLTRATAKLYGLRVDKKVDERLNLEKETDAAVRFLDHLYDRFGCWYLAAAAYNAGENRVARIMNDAMGRESGRDRDYYRIWKKLPAETRDFVPAIVALKRIGRNRAKYGF